MRYFKWMANNGPIYGSGTYAVPGEWQEHVTGQLVPCENGYHVCTREQLTHWCGTELIEVEIDESDMIHECDKCVVHTWREIRRFDWDYEDMADYAQWCAGRTYDDASAYMCETAAFTVAHTSPRAAAHTTSYIASYVAAGVARICAVLADDDIAAVAAVSGSARERLAQLEWIENRIGESLK